VNATVPLKKKKKKKRKKLNLKKGGGMGKVFYTLASVTPSGWERREGEERAGEGEEGVEPFIPILPVQRSSHSSVPQGREKRRSPEEGEKRKKKNEPLTLKKQHFLPERKKRGRGGGERMGRKGERNSNISLIIRAPKKDVLL